MYRRSSSAYIETSNQNIFDMRLRIAMVVVFLSFLLLLSRFFYLQFYNYEHFHTLSDNNRISLVPIVPNRGIIKDRHGVILAYNSFFYTLEITPSTIIDRAKDKKTADKELNNIINIIGSLIEVTQEDKKQFKKLREQTHGVESIPIRTRLSEVEAAIIAANRYRLSGVEIKSRLFREYPRGKTAAHVIGYIGRISSKETIALANKNALANYKGSDYMGKEGVEQFYESALHGKTGFRQIEVNSDKQAVRILASTPPVHGDDLILSIDTRLQEIAERAFGDEKGALVALDPATGEILAYVSMPSFNPNTFVGGVDEKTWSELNESASRPLMNRPIRGIYPPGSTIKPFVALAGLHEKKRVPPYAINDTGTFTLPGNAHAYRDWKPTGHGFVDMQKAISVSCDTFFYGLAQELTIEKLSKFLKNFEFGKKTGIDLHGELSGLLPTPEWKKKRFKKPWFPGETIIVGIGQGYVLATPLQLAKATAILANRGKVITPHLVKEIQTNHGDDHPFPAKDIRQLMIPFEHTEIVKNGMIGVTKPGGTASSIGANATYTIAAKTGTAQVVGIKQGEKYHEFALEKYLRDHALFIAYAPAEDPKIVLSVIVENGGHGATVAGPIALQVLNYYLLGETKSSLQNQQKITIDESD